MADSRRSSLRVPTSLTAIIRTYRAFLIVCGPDAGPGGARPARRRPPYSHGRLGRSVLRAQRHLVVQAGVRPGRVNKERDAAAKDSAAGCVIGACNGQPVFTHAEVIRQGPGVLAIRPACPIATH